MGSGHAATDVQVVELNTAEAAGAFDAICQRELGMSGAEFLRRWDAGDYRDVDIDDVDGLPDVVGALPLVR
jgi:hypothetical protein